MNILVSGSAGFIGYHLTKRLLNEEHFVAGVDSLINSDMHRVNALANFGSQYQFYKYDLCDIGKVQEIFSHHKFDCVFHLAALGSVPRSVLDPCKTIHNNVMSTANLLWVAYQNRVGKFVHSSSASVYGTSGASQKYENAPLDPCNPYGVSKLSAEKLVTVFWENYKLPTIALRYFNVFGPDQSMGTSYSAVIPQWLYALSEKSPMVIYGNGNQRRDFTYVENVVEANLLAMQTTEHGQCFNVGCGNFTSINELSKLIESEWGSVCTAKYAEKRVGDIDISYANIDKATTILKYNPTIHVKEGIKKTVEWFKTNVNCTED